MSNERTLLLLVLVMSGCSHGEPANSHTRSTADNERETSGTEVRHDDDIEPPPARPTDTHIAEADGVPTAMEQSNEPTDLEITRTIREAVLADDSISIGARSTVVIVTRGAMVTLRGDVSNDHDRSAIDAHAHQASGVMNVDNRITVTP